MSNDSLLWVPRARVEKYDWDQARYVECVTEREANGDTLRTLCNPYEVVESEGNLLTTAGLTRLTGLVIGTLSTPLDATRVRLGAGDSATAATTADASLGANQYFAVMDAPYPTASAGVLTFQSTFGATVANYAWQCWGLDVGTATVASGATAATLVNRKVASNGTKASGNIWVLNVTVTLS